MAVGSGLAKAGAGEVWGGGRQLAGEATGRGRLGMPAHVPAGAELPRLSGLPAQPGPGPPPCVSRGSNTPKVAACLFPSVSPSSRSQADRPPALERTEGHFSPAPSGTPAHRQLGCLQAARSRTGATGRPPPCTLQQAPTSGPDHLPAGAPGLPRPSHLSPHQPLLDPSSLITQTHVHRLAFLHCLPFSALP